MRTIPFVEYMQIIDTEWKARGISEPLNDTIIINFIAHVCEDLDNEEVAEILHEALHRAAVKIGELPVLINDEELARLRDK